MYNILQQAHDLDLKISQNNVPDENEIDLFCEKIRELSINELNQEEIIELYHTVNFISHHVENYLTDYSRALPVMRLFLAVGKLDGYLSAIIFKKENGNMPQRIVPPVRKDNLPIPDNSENARKILIKDCLLLKANEE